MLKATGAVEDEKYEEVKQRKSKRETEKCTRRKGKKNATKENVKKNRKRECHFKYLQPFRNKVSLNVASRTKISACVCVRARLCVCVRVPVCVCVRACACEISNINVLHAKIVTVENCA